VALALPGGTRCFVDANILYYHFVETPPFSDPCSAFLQRIVRARIQGAERVSRRCRRNDCIAHRPSAHGWRGSGSSGLLTNDALTVALMRRKGLTHRVTNDDDFDSVANLTIWKPR
jgi:predicted nucleic acid-binding protein